MTTVSDTLQYLSTILGDQQTGREYRVYSKKFLRNAAQEALAVIASKLPDLLAYESSMILKEGTTQDNPCPGARVELVEGNAQEVDTLSEGATSILFSKCDDTGYKAQAYVNVAGFKQVKLQPPVPANMAGTSIKVMCKGKVPPDIDLTDDNYDLSSLPNDAIQIINDWVLYRSYLTDDQNVHSSAEADRLYQRLLQRLGDEFQQNIYFNKEMRSS